MWRHRHLPTVAIDKVRYERILGNLIDNAHNHGDGPVRIEIAPWNDDGGNDDGGNHDGGDLDRVSVAVEDAGPGVATSEHERIFERFARGSAARNRIGTGLGLALVAEHSMAMGGHAWVEDRPGGGARFVVELPTRLEATWSES